MKEMAATAITTANNFFIAFLLIIGLFRVQIYINNCEIRITNDFYSYLCNKYATRMSLKEKVQATMKSEDTESAFELYVTRTPGYLWALLFRNLHVHPINVTLLSIVIGAASGYFFYFSELRMNLIGMGLLVWANWYDCADGQLARMTGQRTLIGRLLDGLAGDIWFFCIYLGLTLRMQPQLGWWAWALCAFAGFICHARQCALADYYRNIHLWFAFGDAKSEFDTYARQNRRFHQLHWQRGEWFEKLYLFFYRAYTHGQEAQTPQLQAFLSQLEATCGNNIPPSLRHDFRMRSLPLMPLTNILTFDLRVGVLFLSLLVGAPVLFPLFEILILEPVRFYTRRRHEAFCAEFRRQLPAYYEKR